MSGFERPSVVIRGGHHSGHQWSSEAPSEAPSDAISRGHHAPRPLFGSPDLIRRNRRRRNRPRAHLWGRGEGAVVSACLVGDEPVGGRTWKNSSTNAHGNQRRSTAINGNQWQSTTINDNQRHSGARTEELEHAAAELVQEGQWVEKELDRADKLIPAKLGQEGGCQIRTRASGTSSEAINMLSACNHRGNHVPLAHGALHVIRGNQHAITMQSACNQHAITYHWRTALFT